MKILFFDYWLKGIANFNRLMPEIRRQCPDAEVKMVHVGSWKEPQESIVNEHDGFFSYDISYYKTGSFYKVLKIERPDVVVMLNLYYLFDKAVIVFCRKLGIKTVYLAHGKFSTIADERFTQFLKQDLKKNFASKIRRDTINLLCNYLNSTLLEYSPMRFVRSMIAMVRDPASMTLNSIFTEELDADIKLVYYESDRQALLVQRKFPDRNIFVVGNPELDAFINKPTLPRVEFLLQLGIPDGPYLLYLDDGFVQARLMEKRVWYDHLGEIARIAHAAGMQFVIKLHPRTPLADHHAFFSQENIIPIDQKIDFKSLISHSETVVSIVSTTISFALLLGKRVISPRWGATAEFKRSYPEQVVHYSQDAENFAVWLVNNQPCNTSVDYVADNLGVLDGQAVSRIVTQIINA
ncbi:hypothetical protein [uncultured Alistipes sp.]|uniref:hypothetical protein n=1 Tax=uncultured Alistipes sp. TaxID=538949 RepID=UPI00261A77B8|nr:hypothetical protein [uncultured Alistipes sp.]